MHLRLLMLIIVATSSLMAKEALATSVEPAFSFRPPAFGEAAGQVLYYFLPAADDFAANINLQIQDYPGTLTEYDALTQQQFKDLKVTIIKREATDDELLYEYTGHMSDRDLHWFARAIKRGDKIYLITATGLASSWESQQAALTESILSFAVGN